MHQAQRYAPGLLCLFLLPSVVLPHLPFPAGQQRGAQRSLERELVHIAEQTMLKQRTAESVMSIVQSFQVSRR